MYTPLKIKEKVFGSIQVLTLGDHAYSAEDLNMLSASTRIISPSKRTGKR